MKKRIIAFIVSVVMAAGLLAGCGKSADNTVCPVHVEGAVFGGKADDSIAAELTFNPRWLTKENNGKYQPNLAAFSALLCADVYFRQKDLDRGSQNRVLPDQADAAAYDPTALLKGLGFSDVRYVETYKEKQYDADTNDSATITMGYLCSDEKYDIFVVALRGCFSAQEWMSAFDPGYAGASYTACTGEHAEWKHPENYKGADIAAGRASEFINAFIAEHDDPKCKNCILLTGHSRGGMLANILGADFENNADFRSYTYTFNSVPVTADPKASQYKTIFNIFDTGDFYANLFPFGSESFYRYGKDLPVDLAGSDEIRAALAALKGRDDYAACDQKTLEAYQQLFSRRFADRASLYQSEKLTETFPTMEEAQARAEECRSLISADAGLGLEAFCRVEDVCQNGDGTCSVTVEYCGAALLWGYCKILSYGDAAHAGFLMLFRGDETGCAIADMLTGNAAGIAGGHLLANSYVLTRFADAKK